MSRRDRYAVGLIIGGVLLGGYLLYATRPHEGSTTQSPPLTAPEMPAAPGAGKGA